MNTPQHLTPEAAEEIARRKIETSGKEPETESTAVVKRGVDALEQRLLSVAQTPAERAEVFNQLSEYRRSKMIRIAATEITNLSWGKKISDLARGAIARYALETGTDPVRHWTVLGGNLYDTAQLWFDLAASQPDYDGHSEPEYINDDERADEEERNRRRAQRVKYNVPEDVKGACIVVVYRIIRGVRTPFVGVNWAGNRECYVAAKNAMGTKYDPIGEQDPGKTSFTRAFRRAAKTAWPIWPYRRLMAPDEGLSIEELGRAEVGEVIQQGRDAEKRSGATPEEPGMFPTNPDTPPAAIVQPDLAVRTSHTTGKVDADAAERAYEQDVDRGDQAKEEAPSKEDLAVEIEELLASERLPKRSREIWGGIYAAVCKTPQSTTVEDLIYLRKRIKAALQ